MNLKLFQKICHSLLVFLLIFGILFNFDLSFISFLKEIFVKTSNASSGDVILLWDTANGAVPGGWTCISCAASDPWYGVFPRASSTYATASSSSNTHANTVTYSSATQGADDDTTKGNTPGTASVAINTHTHTWGNRTVTATSHLPLYKNLNFIKANNPSVIPSNVIAIFDSANLPTGWTRYSAMDGRYLRGFSDNVEGGTPTHAHPTGAVTSGSSGAAVTDSGSGASAASSHTHTLAASSTPDGLNNPEFVNVVLAYNSSGSNITIASGTIALFDASPPADSGWDIISDTAPWNGKLLVSTSTPGGTGGNATDNHDGTAVYTSGTPSATNSNRGTTGALIGAHNTHTHNVTYTISSVSTLPTYRDVILAKRIGYQQSAYRFFENQNATSVGPALANQDTPATLTSSGQAFRLRTLLHVLAGDLATSSQNFRLEYAGKGAGTCASPSGDPSSYNSLSSTASSTIKTCGFADNDTSVGTLPWGIDSTCASESANSTISMDGSTISNRLVVNNFGFSISNSAIIKGIEVYFSRQANFSSVIKDNSAYLVSGGSIIGNDKKDSAYWPIDPTQITYGSSTDTWGLSTASLTPALVNDSAFGFGLMVVNDDSFVRGANITTIINMKIYYELAQLIYFQDNSAAIDGSALMATTTDPTHSSHTVVNQTYEESNNFTNSSAILAGQDGKWDFALKDNGAPASTTYCFRVAKADGSALDAYNVYPEITTAQATTLSCSASTSTTAFGALGIASVYTSSPNITLTSSCGYAGGCTVSVKDQGSGLNPGLYKSVSPTHLIASADATLSAGTEGYGIQTATTSNGSGAVLSLNSKYLKTGNQVGGLSIINQNLATSSASFTSREMTITHKAAAGVLTKAGNFSDTITYSCVGN